jgi:hypothetical protein
LIGQQEISLRAAMIVAVLLGDLVRIGLRTRAEIIADNLFLRRQLRRWKYRPLGRPPLPKNLRALIVTMAEEKPSWGG